MKMTKEEITKMLIGSCTEFGMHVVQDMAAQVLIQNPNMSLREFINMLEQQGATIKQHIINLDIPQSK